MYCLTIMYAQSASLRRVSYSWYTIIMQGQVQFYIQVVDRDSDDPNDHVDDIYADISMSPSASFSPVISYSGVHDNGRIELSFRVQCEASFFGENCTTFCQPTNDSTGCYTCGPNGKRIMLFNCDQSFNGME